MEYNNIVVQVKEGIATITFNRPEILNALNEETLKEFSNVLDEIHANEDIRVLILTGAGEKSFIAGADIKQFLTFNTLKAKSFSEMGRVLMNKLQELPIPVIAAVNGFALGGGCEVAMACDFIYASENAMFGLPEITLGIIPGFGGTQRLPRLVGESMAKELIFTGKMIPAEEAKNIGLANKVCSQEQLMDEVIKTAKTIASRGKVSLRAAKQAINNGMNVDITTGCHMEIDAFALCFTSPDVKEGASAFLEKRTPDFKGSLKE
ncbi:MAG: enoyl-CoA hydratase/isomerase family protein [Deltaproteobacteria bacterium]|nr:enoyl-CoA hydratase/isomerase family protein [Deltaproteobacteria bacterium]